MLAGPTASGKSAAAFRLARQHGLEIVSADAMQVYRGMDIGTAKPPAGERELVPHHLLDVVSPAEPFSVADYVRLAEEAIAAILSRGRLPLVTGGTGFYLGALRRGLPTVPPADRQAQEPLWQQVEQGGLHELMAELQRLAPRDAIRAGSNPRRVVRSLEVLRTTGEPPSSFPLTPPRHRYQLQLLTPSNEVLRQRITARTAAMFKQGLVAEVAWLLQRYPQQPTALQAIGYKEVAEHLRGETSLPEAQAAVESATHRYAKRQRTWFRAEPEALTVTATGEEAAAQLDHWLAALLEQAG